MVRVVATVRVWYSRCECTRRRSSRRTTPLASILLLLLLLPVLLLGTCLCVARHVHALDAVLAGGEYLVIGLGLGFALGFGLG